jgi:hypothetical protein
VEGARERREVSSGEDSTAADGRGERSGRRKRGGGNEGEREVRVRDWGFSRGTTVFCGYGLSQGELRSSIRASLLSPAEGPFLYEVGISQLDRADLPNNKMGEILG